MSKPFIQTWSDFFVVCHAKEQREGLFTVTSKEANHRSFQKLSSLLLWMTELDLSPVAVLKENSGETVKIDGTYRTAMHSNIDVFLETQTEKVTKALTYGEYTYALISKDEDGICTLHMMEPLTRGRIVLPYRESKELYG